MVEKKEDIDKLFLACMKHIDASKDSGLKLSNDEKLKFYALYKVATVGECKSIIHSINNSLISCGSFKT
jgi:acyl-CoA-binding protein